MLTEAIHKNGLEHFKKIKSDFLKELRAEEEKKNHSFMARKKAIERVDLPEVRQYRLRQLVEEHQQWKNNHNEKSKVLPDITLHLALKVQGCS